jgi:transcriptional regulator with XRE-family HTH domain
MDKSLYSKRQLELQQLLRELRQSAGLRQQDVAERIDEPQSFVSKYESGERRLDVLELRELCQCLGITLFRFITLLEKRLTE